MSRLEQVRYEEDIAKEHYDARRNIDNPDMVLSRLDGSWHPHSILTINQSGLELAKHFHDYNEVFFSPNGGIKFALADIVDNPNKIVVYELERGSRLYIPRYVGHLAVGKEGSVLLGFGDTKFDPKRLIPCESGLVERMREALK